MDDACKPASQVAGEEAAKDMDLDIPVDDACKEAIRWLLTQAFLNGCQWQHCQIDNETVKMMKSIKDTTEYWLNNH